MDLLTWLDLFLPFCCLFSLGPCTFCFPVLSLQLFAVKLFWYTIFIPFKRYFLRETLLWGLQFTHLLIRACAQMPYVASVRTARTVAARPLCPWAFPGENAGVGCHALLQGVDLPSPGMEHTPLTAPALAGGLFITGATWKALSEPTS